MDQRHGPWSRGLGSTATEKKKTTVREREFGREGEVRDALAPGWVPCLQAQDHGKYKSTFLRVIREVEDARSRITDPASALSKQLASMAVSSPVDATVTTDTGSAAVGGVAHKSVAAAGSVAMNYTQTVPHAATATRNNEVSAMHDKFFQVMRECDRRFVTVLVRAVEI